MGRKLYIYSDHNRYEYRIEHGDIPFLKIGDTEQEDTSVRVEQQDTTSSSEPLDIKYEIGLPDGVRDHDIHDFLRSKNVPFTRLDKKREWFLISLKDAILLINQYIFGSHRPDSYAMRDEQQLAHDKIVTYFNSHKSEPKAEFLLAAKMRFGKNFTLLNAIKTLKCKKVLVITYKPWVFDSLENDINNHVLFEDFQYVDFLEDRSLSTLCEDKVNIIVASAQLSLNESKDNSNNEKDQADNIVNKIRQNLQILKRFQFDMVIVDEYHYGTTTANFRSLLNELQYTRLVYVSGTAMRDIKSHRFDDDQLFNWTYIDEQMKPGNDMPRMRLFALSLDESIIKEAQKYYTEDEYPNMTKLFEVDENDEFVHKNLVNMTLEQIFGKGGQHRKASPFLIDGIDTPQHIFCLMPPNVKSIQAMSNLIKRDYGHRFVVIKASGSDGVKTEKELLSHINKAKAEHRSTITLSCIRFREGVTIPDWDSVIMLDDGESAVSYFQAIFRCQSQRKEKPLKRECYVFDYNPQRMLMLTYLMTEVQSLTSKDSHQQTAQRFLDCAPMVGYDAQNRLYKVDLEYLLSSFFVGNKVIDKGFRSFDQDRNFNYEALNNIDKAYIKLLPQIKSGKAKPVIEVVSDNSLSGGKNTTGRKVEKSGVRAEQSELESLKHSLRYISSRLPEYMFNTIENEHSLQDILDTGTQASHTFFRDLCLTDLEVFKQLITDHILDERLMNRLISNYKMEEDSFWKNRTPDGYDYMRKKYFIDDEEDVKTPIVLARQMLDLLPYDIWSNPEFSFCDIACKDPSFLLVIKYRLMEGLKSIIPNETLREQHILKNMLYGLCRTETQQNFIRRVLKMEKCGEHIIYCNNNIQEYLKHNVDMPKFDIVVMNPPYKKGIHLSFLQQALNIGKKIILSIQPAQWLMSEKDMLRMRSGKTQEFCTDYLNRHGANIKLVDGQRFFDAEIASYLGIFYFNKEKTQRIIIEDASGLVADYDNVSSVSKYGNAPIYLGLKKKILDAAGKDNLHTHVRVTSKFLANKTFPFEDHPKEKYFVRIARIRGHVAKNGYQDDFYTIIPDDRGVDTNVNDATMYFSFNNKQNALNFITYLKTDFARFALSMYKLNTSLDTGELYAIPWLDFSKVWNDKKLEELFSISNEERSFIRAHIPDFYGIRK